MQTSSAGIFQTQLDVLNAKIEKLRQVQLQTRYIQNYIGTQFRDIDKNANTVEDKISDLSVKSETTSQKLAEMKDHEEKEDLESKMFVQKMLRWGSALDKMEMFQKLFDFEEFTLPLQTSFAGPTSSTSKAIDTLPKETSKTQTLKKNKIKPSKENKKLTPPKIAQKINQKDLKRRAQRFWTTVGEKTHYGVATVRERF